MKKALIFAILLTFVGAFGWAQDTKTPTTSQPAAATKVLDTTKAPAADPLKVAAEVEMKKEASAAEVKKEEAAELSWWKMLLKHLMELVFLVLGIMATAFVTVLMKKYGFEAQSGKVNDVLMKAAGWAEQKSIKAAKLEGKPDDSAKKMEAAVDFAKKLAQEYKLPEKGKDWWEDKLESWLGVSGASKK